MIMVFNGKQQHRSDYWAAVPTSEIGMECSGKVDRYFAYLTSSSLVDLWRKSFYSYYGLLSETAISGFGLFAIGSLIPGGAEGEICKVKINHQRNLIQHQLVLTTQQRPAMECRAINSDSASLAQASLGDGILDFFMREKHLERNLKDAVEISLVTGESYVRLDWNAAAGKQYGVNPTTGQPVYDGDIVVKTYNPFDIIRDTTRVSADAQDWYICHSQESRWNLAAKHPDKKDDILSNATDTLASRRFIDPTKIIPAAGIGSRDTEMMDVYEFMHKRTEAMPEGRYTVFLQGGTVLFDGPLPFRKLPLHRVAAADIIGSPFGWTIAFDTLAIQELIDKLYSVVATNQMATGIQNFWMQIGDQLTKQQIAGGLNLLESMTKPEVLQLCATPAEVFNFIKMLEAVMETLHGISAVNRGATPENLKSGSALAFVAAQAVTFTSGLQSSYNQLIEGVGTSIIEILKDYAATPRLAVIAGSFNRPLMKEFVGKELQQIDRVVVTATSAMSKTTAGKIQIAQDLLQSGLIRNSREYLTVVNTGELDSLTESEMSEIILTHAENEDLRNGKQVFPLKIDDHSFHVLEHRALLNNPDSRRDGVLVNNVLNHIDQHIQLQLQLQDQEPALLGILKLAPLQAPTPPQMPPGPQQNMAQNVNATPQMVQQAQEVKPSNMPNMPRNASPQDQAAHEQQIAGIQNQGR